MNKFNKELISKLSELLPPSRSGFKNVLVIDDELKNLSAFKGQFRQKANILTASNKEEALSIVNNNDIDIVFCDYKMGNISGADILKEIVNLYPNIKRVIVTGYYDSVARNEFKEKTNTEDFIIKPWSVDDILLRLFGLNRI